MREGDKIRHTLATHGMPAEVADALDVASNGEDPAILRGALINALRCIARQEHRMSDLEAKVAALDRWASTSSGYHPRLR